MVKAFAWLVANKNVNTNDLFQLRGPNKALSLDHCVMCLKSIESANHIFHHYAIALVLWYNTNLDWVPFGGIAEMLEISFKIFGTLPKGNIRCQMVALSLIWFIWLGRNARILRIDGDQKLLFGTWYFSPSFLWASTPKPFMNIPFYLLILDWKCACYPISLKKSMICDG